MRTDADPADSSIAVDNERRTPGEVDRVDTYRLVHAVRARHCSRFVKENREGIRVFFDVILSPEEPVDLLPGNEHDTGVAFYEFLIS